MALLRRDGGPRRVELGTLYGRRYGRRGASVFAPAVRAGEKFPAQPSGRAGGQRPMLGLGRGARGLLLGIPT